MSCICSELRSSFYKRELGTKHLPEDEAVDCVRLLSPSSSLCRLLNSKQSTMRHSFMFRMMENLYEKCAAYNLKYCPIRGFTKHNSYVSNTMKDLIILACFLIANFVVFLTIFSKTLVHLFHVMFVIARWIGRSHHVAKQPIPDAETMNSSVTKLAEGFFNIKKDECNWSVSPDPSVHWRKDKVLLTTQDTSTNCPYQDGLQRVSNNNKGTVTSES
ncbi:unnamed protein product [Arctia plantaginis]|uniref:Uncharacterized protein n=1 Tax=Arctia plantaginis TaxID=874455 RepID=A0A8S0Z439_ARCPL|nr:unnamed protein product [Arctia plantaginis]